MKLFKTGNVNNRTFNLANMIQLDPNQPHWPVPENVK